MVFEVPSNPNHSMILRLSTVLLGFPEFCFPCMPQSVTGLTEMWEPFLIVSLFTALATTAALIPGSSFILYLGEVTPTEITLFQ